MENTYNGTKFCNVLRVKLAVYPVYFTGNTANSTAVYRKHRKNPTPPNSLTCLVYCRYRRYNKKTTLIVRFMDDLEYINCVIDMRQMTHQYNTFMRQVNFVIFMRQRIHQLCDTYHTYIV